MQFIAYNLKTFGIVFINNIGVELFLAERRIPSSLKALKKFLVLCFVSCFAKMKINMCFKLIS